MANKTKLEERDMFTIDDKVVEIGLKAKKKYFVAYKYVRDSKTLRSKYEYYTEKHFEARGHYNKLINDYNNKINSIHGL